MENKQIIRVFPTKTRATPNDELVYFGMPTLFAEADEVHISVLFTWDLEKAERLAEQWKYVAPVKIGGPATGQKSFEFIPGKYVRKGYTITSRGCPNKCWFCSVWKREGNGVRELKIKNGWNILDDNFLACSDQHIKKVFEMLKRQPKTIKFTGGLEAARLKEEQIDLFLNIKLESMYFAYDTFDDLESLTIASRMLKNSGIIRNTSHAVRCYVLIGYPKDTFKNAEKRLRTVIKLGFMPFAMLYRNETGYCKHKWKLFQREWVNPFIVATKMKKMEYLK